MKNKLSLAVLLSLLVIVALSLSACFLIEKPEGDGTGNGGQTDGGDLPGDGDGEGDGGDGQGGTNIPEIDFSGVSFPNVTVDYNGKPHSIEIVGTPGNLFVTTEYEGNGAVDAGEYTVTAKFYFKGEYIEGKDMTATLTVKPIKFDTYGFAFDDKTVIYNGKTHGAFIRGKLPEGTSVKYTGNGQSEIGEYTVTASFTSSSKNYLPLDDMTATLRIVDGPEALGGLSLSDMTVEYDGNRHGLVLSGAIPSGVTVKYSVGEKSHAGVYPCDATLKYSGGEYVLSATLTILARKVTASAEDLTVTYDGEEHRIELDFGDGDKLAGLDIIEIGNGVKTPGVHEVRFRFAPKDGYKGDFLYIPDVNATLTVLAANTQCDSGLVFGYVNGKYAVVGYTGSEKTVAIPSTYTDPFDNHKRTVTGIGAGAFRGNTTIECISLPSTVKVIGLCAFEGCTSLTEVNIPEGVTVIGSRAFEDTALKDVVLPDSLQAIGQSAFRGAKVERISLPFIGGSRVTSNKYIGYIFGASDYVANEVYLPTTLKTVVLKDSCSIVYAYSFFGCTSVEEIIIGSGVREIGVSAFQGCTSLIGLYIPKTVTDIPALAEYYNSPVFGCASGLTVGTDAASKLQGWSARWDILSVEERAVKLYGVSYNEYIDAIRASEF